jgi:hypothetical protein
MRKLNDAVVLLSFLLSSVANADAISPCELEVKVQLTSTQPGLLVYQLTTLNGLSTILQVNQDALYRSNNLERIQSFALLKMAPLMGGQVHIALELGGNCSSLPDRLLEEQVVKVSASVKN